MIKRVPQESMGMRSDNLHRLRDSDGKGMLGCMFLIVLIGVAIYLGIVLAPIYYSNFNFESAVKTEISRAGAHFLDDETMTKDILDIARRNEINLKRENISIERFAGQVHVNVHYAVPVDFIVLKRDLVFEIDESSFIGTL
jgi:hypothetical protein